jgi:UDP-N-acetylmuramoyl-tripeptide--D-alanyl-D-alanine ligase
LALGRLAARYRAEFNIPVVAVGGSNGKTTTKELLACVLRKAQSALWSEASFNNDIGVPLTLLQLEPKHRVAVLEVGTNHPGELAPLVRVIRPQTGVLTSIGREHLEFFGDLAGVANEEGWLAELLPAEGTLFIDGDSEWTPLVTRRCPAKVCRVGLGAENDWRADRITVADTGTVFHLEAPAAGYSGEYRLPLVGRHQALNAMFALAVAAELGVLPDVAREGLAGCRGPKLRLQLWESGGVRVLDDTYNANADSMRAALDTLRDLPCAGRRVAVLGDMAELGEHTAAAHREIGRKAGQMNLGLLVGVGSWAAETVRAAQEAGLRNTWCFTDVPTAAGALRSWLSPGDLVLLKASRAAGLDRIGDLLRAIDA